MSQNGLVILGQTGYLDSTNPREHVWAKSTHTGVDPLTAGSLETDRLHDMSLLVTTLRMSAIKRCRGRRVLFFIISEEV